MTVQMVQKGTLQYLAADEIRVPHCFTTRLGGVSTGILSSMNLGWNRGDPPENVTKNVQILAAAVGFDPEKLVLTRQTHSDIVRPVTDRDAAGLNNRTYPECDALITNTPGTALMVFAADCTPILFWDPVTGAVGAAHAGWRGTASKIAAKTVRAMEKAFGCDPKNIRAAIGPNIGMCCFETDEDVPQAMLAAYGAAAEPFISRRGDKYFPDLKAINALALQEAGVEHIERSTLCTACAPDVFWSHRVTGGKRGSQGAVIVCKEAGL